MKNTTLVAVLLCAVLVGACSDDTTPVTDGALVKDGGAEDASTNVPAKLKVTSGKTAVIITTSPLVLSMTHDDRLIATGKTASATDPQGVFTLGQAKPFLESRFYDPGKPPESVTWSAATKVIAYKKDGEGYALTLDNGSTVTIKPDAKVSGALRLDLVAPAPDEKIKDKPQTALSRVCMSAQAKERFFGFGEVLDGPSSRGVVRPMQIQVDTTVASGYNEVHVPVPLAISPRGWAMLVQDFHAGAFDVAKASNEHICATFHTHKLTTYLMTAKDPLDLVERTVSLTAKPALPPDWAFGPQQWRNEHKSQTELMDDATDMRKYQVPNSVMWIDNPWQTGYNTHEFDPKRFSDPKGAISKLHALGYKVLIWSTPYINEDQKDMYAHGEKNGFFPTDPLGKVLAYKWGWGKGSIIDFTAPGAVVYWQSIIKRVTKLGVDGFKLDFGEEIIPALGVGKNIFRFHGGKNADTMHREFPMLYHKTYWETLPKGQGFMITRAGSLGDQANNTCIWPGDLDADFSTHAEGRVGGLPAAISAGLSLSMSGYPFFGSDIGGYRKGPPNAEVLQRWAEYAALGTIMQLGGGGKHHNPWDTALFGKDALGLYRPYARLHTDLFPYIYSYAVKAAATGRPVTVPLAMAFPHDPATWGRDYQYMLGDYLMVAPVITAGAKTHKVYLPVGQWLYWWTRKTYNGPQVVEVDAPLGKVPLFRTRGAIVARLSKQVDTLAPATDKSVVSYHDHKEGLFLELLPGGGSVSTTTSATLFDGTGVKVTNSGGDVTMEITAGKQFSDYYVQADWTLRKSAPTKLTLDGKILMLVNNAAAVRGCAGGCWYFAVAHRMLFVHTTQAGTLKATP